MRGANVPDRMRTPDSKSESDVCSGGAIGVMNRIAHKERLFRRTACAAETLKQRVGIRLVQNRISRGDHQVRFKILRDMETLRKLRTVFRSDDSQTDSGVFEFTEHFFDSGKRLDLIVAAHHTILPYPPETVGIGKLQSGGGIGGRNAPETLEFRKVVMRPRKLKKRCLKLRHDNRFGVEERAVDIEKNAAVFH